VFVNNVPESVLDQLDGTRGTSVAPGIGQGFTVFAADFTARFGRPPDPFVSNAYDAVVLVGLAAQRALFLNPQSSLTGTDIAAQLRTVANPPGTSLGPGVRALRDALGFIRNGAKVDYAGAYAAFNLDAR